MKMEEQTYKYSKYNIVIAENKNEVTIFNTYSCKHIVIDKDLYDEIKEETASSLRNIPVPWVDLGIFVPSDLDEYDRIRQESSCFVHRNTSLQFVIMLSDNCNYHCVYCFEENQLCKFGDMTIETQKDTIDFIKRECEKVKKLEIVNIEYFGGEPTLCSDIIINISNELTPYFESLNVKYESCIVTNGRFFNKEFIEKIKDCRLSLCQITLDGMPKTYANLKGCKESDFYAVIQNIKDLQDKLHIQIRIHINHNVEELKELMHFIAKEKLKVGIYYQHIKDMDLTAEEYQEAFAYYVEEVKEFEKFLKDNDYTHYFDNRFFKYTCACPANDSNRFAITNRGDLYRCPEQLTNPTLKIGNIKDGVLNKELDDYFVENNPLPNENLDCKNCQIYGHCFGKCCAERLNGKGVNCEAMKQLTIDRIKRLVFNKY